MKGAKHYALRFPKSLAACDVAYSWCRRTLVRGWSRLKDLFSSLEENEVAFEAVVICLGLLPCLLMAVVVFSLRTP
jgi:hypothetical protein